MVSFVTVAMCCSCANVLINLNLILGILVKVVFEETSSNVPGTLPPRSTPLTSSNTSHSSVNPLSSPSLDGTVFPLIIRLAVLTEIQLQSQEPLLGLQSS